MAGLRHLSWTTVLFLFVALLVRRLVPANGQYDGSNAGSGGDLPDGQPDLDPCSKRLDEMRAELRAEIGAEMEKSTQTLIQEWDRKLEEISASLVTCEAATAELREKAESDVKNMQQMLKKERSMRSGSVEQLDAALTDLDELRAAWLPFWASKKVEAVRVAVAPKARQLKSAAKTYGNQALMFWRQQGSPAVQKAREQGWKNAQLVTGVVLRHASRGCDKAWAKVPKKYRKHVDTVVLEARRAWPPLWSAAKRAFVAGQVHFVRAVDEIALLIEQSPVAPTFARESSHIVALLVVSFPLTLVIPALARRQSSRANRVQQERKQQHRKNNQNQQKSKKRN